MNKPESSNTGMRIRMGVVCLEKQCRWIGNG